MNLANFTVQDIFDELSSYSLFNNLSTANKYQVLNNVSQKTTNLYIDNSRKAFYYKANTIVDTASPLPNLTFDVDLQMDALNVDLNS